MKSRLLQIALILLTLEVVTSFQPVQRSRSFPISSTALNTAASSIIDRRPKRPASFRDRMLNSMKKQESPKKKPYPHHKSSLIQQVETLKEFKTVVVDEAGGRLVVVWFYAPWCRACKAVAPGVLALAKRHPDIKFVQVPATQGNTNLHQGLGVPSVPFAHLYHPDGGLVEEQRLTRKYLPGFFKVLQDYQAMSCSLERGDEWSADSPYDPEDKAKDIH